MASLKGPADDRLALVVSELEPWIAARVDLDDYGVFDVVDVLLFEAREKLPHTLSMAMTRGVR